MKLFRVEQLQRDDNIFTFCAELNSSHKILEGHFPQNPIVPGVCTMAMIKDCCALIVGRTLRFDYIKEVKFLSMIVPSLHPKLKVVVTLKTPVQAEAIEIMATVEAENKIMLKLRATII